MLILLGFAFLAGIVTVLSPCILPVLPIVLSGSVSQGKKRPFGIVTGFILSFTFFTLFLSTLVQTLGISAELLRIFSVVVIIAFGVSLLVPYFQAQLEKAFTFFSRFAPGQQKDGFVGGLVIGLSLGLIWTPCVGPILASVISLALTGSVSGTAFFITLAYSLGTAIPMLAIIYGGRELLQKVPWLLSNTQKIQKIFGIVMICTGLAIFFNVDRQFQTWILTTFPNYGVGLTKIEDNQAVKNQLNKLGSSSSNTPIGQPTFTMGETIYPAAPELNGGTEWLNSPPLTFDGELKGKVVLIDFWTYSCINCIRTFPYLTSWYEKYKDKDFVIVGVHAPEFEFEKNKKNVLTAMEDFGITYPVVQDNDFAIWKAYNNRFWPAHYLVDKEGKIRYTHFGEGKYEETENKILELLGETERVTVSSDTKSAPARRQSPETYLGYGRAKQYPESMELTYDVSSAYSPPVILEDDQVALNGKWAINFEYAQAAENDARLSINFLAQKVHLVLANSGQSQAKVTVLLDGKPLPAQYLTEDMNEKGEITVTEARKYDLIDLGEDYGRHSMTLVFSSGVQAYAFTFGS